MIQSGKVYVENDSGLTSDVANIDESKKGQSVDVTVGKGAFIGIIVMNDISLLFLFRT